MTACLVALLVWLAATGGGQGGASAQDPAARAYAEGRYHEASELYGAQLAASGAARGPLLFNLANCSFRLGRHADAVWYYKRAQLLLPGDGESAFNLALAEARLGVGVTGADSMGAAVLASVDALTQRELLLLVSVLQSVGLAGLLLSRRRRWLRNIAALLILLGLAGSGRLVHAHWFGAKLEAVVLANEAPLRVEPHRDMPAAHVLQAGESVRVEELSDRWARVSHAKGSGWTPRSGLGLVE